MRQQVVSTPVRTRFAPSPTGDLHIGGARTALFSWLYAKHHQGQFILRIEDTDVERSTPEAVQLILASLKWLGLDYDQGPYFQTHRFERYLAILEQLLSTGKAYRCYCSQERLQTLRTEQLAKKQKPRYDGFCRDRHPTSIKQPFVVRFRNPQEGTVTVNDQVHGTVVFENHELDDLIIARRDGSTTYNFSVVVDDWDMAITHVIRGDDHLNNTPRQINMLLALGASPPIYAHVPMILGPDGKKLSKRHGAASVIHYREAGYLPEALLNYLARLGWSRGDQEIFSRAQLIEYFDINALNRAPAAVNPGKLSWLNQHYLKAIDPTVVAERLAQEMQRLHLNLQQGPALVDVVLAQRERVKTLKEMAEKSQFFYQEPPCQKGLVPCVALPALRQLLAVFRSLEIWNEANLHQCLTEIALQHQLSLGQLLSPLRLLLTGSTVSPPIDQTLKMLGKKRVFACLEQAL